MYCSDEAAKKYFKTKQANEVSTLPNDVMRRILNEAYLVDFSRDGPSSAIISLEPKLEESTDARYRSYRAVLLSDYVMNNIACHVKDDLWTASLGQKYDSRKKFEQFLRLQLQDPEPSTRSTRECIGKGDDAHGNNLETVKVGGCAGEVGVRDMLKSIASQATEDNGRTKLLYSIDKNHALFDMIYREGDDTFHAFHATTAKNETLPATRDGMVRTLVEKLDMAEHTNRRVYLYYATPHFNSFGTAPVKFELPTIDNIPDLDERFKIFHLEVRNDNVETN